MELPATRDDQSAPLVLRAVAPDELNNRMTAILRASGAPLRAVDIVRRLAETGVATQTASVNKVLYSGAYARTPGPGKPTWTACAVPPTPFSTEGMFTFKVDRLGVFSLENDTPGTDLELLLACLADLMRVYATKTLRPDASAGGQKVARLARAAGFSVANAAGAGAGAGEAEGADAGAGAAEVADADVGARNAAATAVAAPAAPATPASHSESA
jgi:hypothetical protein